MELARTLFGADVDLAEIDPVDAEIALFDAERAQIANAVDRRVREYAAARHLFRRLTTRRGLAEAALVNDADRAPRWPSGLVGSITHTAGYCGVVLAPADAIAGLGIDCEPDAPLERSMWRAVTTRDELSAWEAREAAGADAGAHARIVFSAKEASYKAQYALTRTFLGFDAMHVEVFDDSSERELLRSGRFVSTFTRTVEAAFREGDTLEGRFARRAGFVLTGVTIRRSRPARGHR